MNTEKLTEADLNKQGFTRGFHRISKAHYSQSLSEQSFSIDIVFGLYPKTGGHCAVARAKATWDSFRIGLFPSVRTLNGGEIISDLFKPLFDKIEKYREKGISEEKFATFLIAFGFADLTEYEHVVKARQQKNLEECRGNELKRMAKN